MTLTFLGGLTLIWAFYGVASARYRVPGLMNRPAPRMMAGTPSDAMLAFFCKIG
jgi:hypothetical protein